MRAEVSWVGPIAVAVAFTAFVAAIAWFLVLEPRVHALRRRREERSRERALREREGAASLAGADASLGGDEHLSPECVQAAVAAMAPPAAGRVRARLVGMDNRPGDERDRVVVRVEGKALDELWTLEREGDGWRRLAVESPEAGTHHLAAELIARPDADLATLRDAATIETAQAGGAAPGERFAGLRVAGDPTHALLDLSVVDGRFAPAVLEACVRRTVAAWEEAVDGDDAAFSELADAAAVDELLTGGDREGRTRLVVRGAHMRAVTATALDLDARPPLVTVDVTISAQRFREHTSDGAPVVPSSVGETVTFTDTWFVALSAGAVPWRLTRVRRDVPALRRGRRGRR